MATRPDDVSPALPSGPVPSAIHRLPPATADDLELLGERASAILREALSAALEPETRKILRKWNLREVSELLGLSRKTLERAIDDQKIPVGTLTRGRRLFTLEEIHLIQERLGLRPWRDPKTDRPVVVAVANFKGGVSKSSTAIHLAQYLARKGYRVLAVDLDAQGSLTTLFGLRPDADVDPSKTLSPWLRGPDLVDEPSDWTGTLKTAIQPTYWHGLDLIAANLQLYGAEFAISARRAADPGFKFWTLLQEGLATVSEDYDVIVLDTPPSLSFVTTNAIYAADGLIMPVPPAMMDFSSSVSFFRLLAELLAQTNLIDREEKRFDFLGLLVSKFEPKNPAHIALHDWLRAAFTNRVLVNTMGMSAVIRVGADIKTAYEIDRYDGDRRTLARALEYLDGVNGEIEQAIRLQWPSKQGRRGATS